MQLCTLGLGLELPKDFDVDSLNSYRPKLSRLVVLATIFSLIEASMLHWLIYVVAIRFLEL